VRHYTYVGKILTYKKSKTTDWKKITNANRTYYAVLPVLRSWSHLEHKR
jgi:hypothetical protein